MPAAEPAKASEPTVDEPSYFRNLEATLRETLISAQRIADETVAEARKKAKQLVSGAESQAETIVSDSRKQAEDAKAELANVKKVTEEYRARFVRLVQEQMHALKLDDDALLEEDK